MRVNGKRERGTKRNRITQLGSAGFNIWTFLPNFNIFTETLQSYSTHCNTYSHCAINTQHHKVKQVEHMFTITLQLLCYICLLLFNCVEMCWPHCACPFSTPALRRELK